MSLLEVTMLIFGIVFGVSFVVIADIFMSYYIEKREDLDNYISNLDASIDEEMNKEWQIIDEPWEIDILLEESSNIQRRINILESLDKVLDNYINNIQIV